MSSRRWSGVSLPTATVSVSLLMLALTGCGGDGNEGREVASAGSAKTSTSAPKQASDELSEYVDARRTWVACLRDEGFDVPDPDAKGQVDFGDNLEWKRDPKALKAQEKCADLNKPVPEGLEKEMQPELTEAEAEKNRRYSTCMQEKGAPDFPDTGQDGRFQDATWDSTSAGAKRATRECGSIIGIPDDAPAPKG